MRDNGAVDDRASWSQATDVGIACPRRIDEGARQISLADKRLLLIHRMNAMDFPFFDGACSPHAHMPIP